MFWFREVDGKHELVVDWSILEAFSSLVHTRFRDRINVILGLERGGLVPAVVASHVLEVPLMTLKVSGYNDSLNVPLENLVLDEEEVHRLVSKIGNRKVLIVDDVVDSGRTITEVETLLTKYGIRVEGKAALFSKKIEDHVENDTECVSICKNDIWIIFPWEYCKESFEESEE